MVIHPLNAPPGTEGVVGLTATLSHADSVRCPMCPPAPDLGTDCGCTLEPQPCTMHRTNGEHRHCQTCGVPVFVYDTYEDGRDEYDDHECPPGFTGEGPGACKGES